MYEQYRPSRGAEVSPDLCEKTNSIIVIPFFFASKRCKEKVVLQEDFAVCILL